MAFKDVVRGQDSTPLQNVICDEIDLLDVYFLFANSSKTWFGKNLNVLFAVKFFIVLQTLVESYPFPAVRRCDVSY